MTPLSFLDIGFPELCVVAVLGLALYGGRLPEVMRSWGVAYRKLRNSFENLTRETTEVQRQLYTPQPPKDPAALPRPAPAVAAATPPPTAPAPTAGPAIAAPPPHLDVAGDSLEDDAPLV